MDTNQDYFVEKTVTKALKAAHALGKLDQQQTDKIVRSIYETGFNHRWDLAEMAFRETGIGNVRDKTDKKYHCDPFCLPRYFLSEYCRDHQRGQGKSGH